MLKENGYVKRGWCDDITNIINEVLKEPSSIAHKCWLSRKTTNKYDFHKIVKIIRANLHGFWCHVQLLLTGSWNGPLK